MEKLVLLIARILTFQLGISSTVIVSTFVRGLIGPTKVYGRYKNWEDANVAFAILFVIGIIGTIIATTNVKYLLNEKK